MNHKANIVDWLVFALLCCIVVALAVRAGNSDFTYPDASRHALDGVLLVDAVAEHPFANPLEWARDYYVTSPALGMGRYPPLFAAVEAPFYFLLGVCPFAARLAASMLWFGGLLFFYEVTRRRFGRAPAAFAALLLAVAPASVRWSSEPMLELPSLAFLLAAALLLLRHLETGRRLTLTLAFAVCCLAPWVKQPAALGLVPLTLYVARAKGSARSFLHDAWPGLLVAALLLLPLVALSAAFGKANLMLLSGHGTSFPLLSAGNWLYYLYQIPVYYIGWPGTVFLVVGIVSIVRKPRLRGTGFWMLWALVFYLFFSVVGYKSARLAMYLMPPLAWLGGVGFARLVAGVSRLRVWLVWTAAATALLSTLAFSLTGGPENSAALHEAARLALSSEPERILYAGPRNGTFIFRVRELAGRDRPVTVRASKVLYVDTIQEELGRSIEVSNVEEMKAVLARVSPDVVVIERVPSPPPPVRLLAEYVLTDDFDLISSACVEAPHGNRMPVADVYAYQGPRAPRTLELPMPGVGMKLEISPGRR